MSPRPGPRRPHVGVRLDPDQLDWLEREAQRRGLKFSEMVRLAVGYARDHLPR